MINARPGYWDVDGCAWVGAEPMYVVPPARPGQHAHERVIGGGDAVFPAPRADVEATEATEATEPLVPDAPAG